MELLLMGEDDIRRNIQYKPWSVLVTQRRRKIYLVYPRFLFEVHLQILLENRSYVFLR